MSETTQPTAAAGEASAQTQENAPAKADRPFEAITSQEDLDRIIQARLERERKKFEGFDEFKAKAAKADEISAKNAELTELVSTYQAKEEQSKLAAEVAEAAGVPADALRGSTREELEAHAETLKSLLVPPVPVVAGQGRSPSKVEETDDVKAVRQLFNS
ncbi:hypothetical protein M3B43_07450 [Nesterenkonia massiliensis]|uniref:Scaffolding protein n=1 Tax=Nesterenkonia massiliensis TaxID=1232429 RepID=A0ABT2HR43_9MICC|nr:hypothetical protein [Nesterenkonia massiliensis]MCT1607163.1 hypothetical protein [Nesterenkonia massiliensis]